MTTMQKLDCRFEKEDIELLDNNIEKLGFDNRAQVIRWCVRKQLRHFPEDLQDMVRDLIRSVNN